MARRKLRQLEIAGQLNDLRVSLGNRLEALTGDSAGQHNKVAERTLGLKLSMIKPWARSKG